MKLNVKGMTCGHCEAAVARAVKGAAPQVEVAVDRARGRVEITGAIREAGYYAAPAD